MKFLSVCSGIEAASVAWKPLGWQACAFSEIEKFPSAVLAHHWPDVPNLGDMTKYNEWPDTLRFNLLVGGTPCQGFSVAGLRGGLEDPRSQLMLTYVEIAARYRSTWLVWENVPGVFSSNGGADFAAFLGALTGREIQVPLGGWSNAGHVEGIAAAYGIAWRTLDSQHFGVPQRRRRVFVVGYLGDWRRAAAVLFDPESLRGDPPPSRKARKEIAATLTSRAGNSSRPAGAHGNLVSPAVTSKWAKGSGGPSGDGSRCGALSAGGGKPGQGTPCVAIGITGEINASVEMIGTLDAGSLSGGGQPSMVFKSSHAVRRLTPREYERLQGFPDNHTLIPWRGKMAPDGPRYKALGNSMAVPVMRWIGERIQAVDSI